MSRMNGKKTENNNELIHVYINTHAHTKQQTLYIAFEQNTPDEGIPPICTPDGGNFLFPPIRNNPEFGGVRCLPKMAFKRSSTTVYPRTAQIHEGLPSFGVSSSTKSVASLNNVMDLAMQKIHRIRASSYGPNKNCLAGITSIRGKKKIAIAGQKTRRIWVDSRGSS